MTIRTDDSLDGIDWAQAKADLAADDFDYGRSPEGLRGSLRQSQHVAIARDDHGRLRQVVAARIRHHHTAPHLDNAERVRIAVRIDTNDEVQLICKHS